MQQKFKPVDPSDVNAFIGSLSELRRAEERVANSDKVRPWRKAELEVAFRNFGREESYGQSAAKAWKDVRERERTATRARRRQKGERERLELRDALRGKLAPEAARVADAAERLGLDGSALIEFSQTPTPEHLDDADTVARRVASRLNHVEPKRGWVKTVVVWFGSTVWGWVTTLGLGLLTGYILWRLKWL